MKKLKIGFVGGGNMARSIIGGLTQQSTQIDIWVCDPDAEKLSALSAEFGTHSCSSNEQMIQMVDAIVLSVKPQVMKHILEPLAKAYQQNNVIIISIAAGIRSKQIVSWLNCAKAPCIRVMPNTPALVSTGASGLFAINANSDQKQIAQDIMNAVGISVWLDDEELIDSVTALSGSGPAYFFLLMEAMQKSAVKNGLDESTARTLIMQTALGAAKLAQNSELEFEALRKQVTSPGGTTEAAINIFQHNRFTDIVDQAVTGATIRSKELSKD